MGKNYIGLAFSASMLPAGICKMTKTDLTIKEVKTAISEGVEICFNPSHIATISALEKKYGIIVKIPNRPPKVSLSVGDSIVILQVVGLPRLTDRHEYTPEEIDSAEFKFIKISVE